MHATVLVERIGAEGTASAPLPMVKKTVAALEKPSRRWMVRDAAAAVLPAAQH